MALPPLSLQLSSGPAISGGNPTTGGATDGAFNPMFGGRKSTAQQAVSMLPLVAAVAVVGFLWMKKRG